MAYMYGSINTIKNKIEIELNLNKFPKLNWKSNDKR